MAPKGVAGWLADDIGLIGILIFEFDFIKENYNGIIIENEPILDGREIDVFLPELNLGIEYTFGMSGYNWIILSATGLCWIWIISKSTFIFQFSLLLIIKNEYFFMK